ADDARPRAAGCNDESYRNLDWRRRNGARNSTSVRPKPNLVYDGNRAFGYDDDNQLTSVLVTNSWKSEFTYDGKGRRRIRREYKWNNSAWLQTTEIHYIYSGNYVIQERNSFNLPLVTYTRLGGRLLARTDNTSGQTLYYHADG